MTDHRAIARALAALIADNVAPLPAEAAGLTVVAQAATAHALLAIEARLGELVEQRRITNIIASLGTDGEDGLIRIEDQAAAEVYVRDHIGDTVNPDSVSETA